MFALKEGQFSGDQHLMHYYLQTGMAGMENEPRWADLPAPILHEIALALRIRSKGCSSSYPFAEIRFVCKAWSRAIPATGTHLALK